MIKLCCVMFYFLFLSSQLIIKTLFFRWMRVSKSFHYISLMQYVFQMLVGWVLKQVKEAKIYKILVNIPEMFIKARIYKLHCGTIPNFKCKQRYQRWRRIINCIVDFSKPYKYTCIFSTVSLFCKLEIWWRK